SLEDMRADGQAIPLGEIDPFTFLATFNRAITESNRRENWSFLKSKWGLASPVPDDFTGLPTFDNRSSWLFPPAAKREQDHVVLLWSVAESVLDGGIEDVNRELFNSCIKLKNVKIGSLT